MTGYIGNSPDITDIYESQQRLKELDQRKDEFLANMSHEIRSPLTGIMGYADILLSKLRDPEDIEYLKTTKESGDYLIEIVNDILDLSKIEAGKLVLNIEPVSVHAVLAEVQGLMDVRARQKSLPLALRFDGVLPETVQTDRTRLRQILVNLVSNAITFTEHGRVEIVARSLTEEDMLANCGARVFDPRVIGGQECPPSRLKSSIPALAFPRSIKSGCFNLSLKPTAHLRANMAAPAWA
jgi:signal transduction histidine kinase